MFPQNEVFRAGPTKMICFLSWIIKDRRLPITMRSKLLRCFRGMMMRSLCCVLNRTLIFSGIPIEQYGSETTEYQQDDYDPTYKYYYMLEDSHEDVLKKLENELLREEIEEQEKAEAAEKRMQELEKGAEEFVHITELKNKRDRHSKMSQEKRAEKERIIQLRKELAMANREREIFCCFVCSRVFADEEGMREHVAEKHLANKKEYFLKCSKCYQRFNKKQHLQRHELTHKNTAYTCRVCSREFRGVVSLKIHMSSAHSMSLDGVHISRELACKCGQKFGVVEELKRHRYYCETRESIAEKRRKAREELDALSTISPTHSASSVYSESTSAASIGSASGRPVKDKSCPFCFLVCASMQSRRRHIERKHPEKLTEEEVDSHSYIKVQTPALPFACELCAKTFASHASLSTHKKRIHENRNDHECTICGRRYPLPSELRKHIKRVHEKNMINC
ncbi:hypothetical protein Y032_0276g1093 [Ancylostoma ceylanicum]|uniref:C2H2-type domain-containing protein n=2 Tax=Ancylostoma ceylanicum TaxID=53326 RepID=A0A016S7G5_9BILA|nr:hypothetical protein Y032_0276g1093 [Ancylostoma ceylanicum]